MVKRTNRWSELVSSLGFASSLRGGVAVWLKKNMTLAE